jgi:hypothetical protein
MKPKAVRIQPLAGVMDTTSSPEDVAQGTWRFLQNMGITDRNKFCFLHGWEKLDSGIYYNNQDLHDQLFGNTREPITFLYTAVATSGYKKLFAGTSRRLQTLNASTGNWQIISDELGTNLRGDCTDNGWTVGQVKNTLVFSNGVDAPVSHVIDQPVDEDSLQAVDSIADLSTIGLTQAKIAFSFRGFIFLANVTMDGEVVSNRIVWSDVDRPLAFKPKVGTSAAGYQDLDPGEIITGAVAVKNRVYVYTTRSVWELTVDGDGPAFGKKFSSPDGAKLPAYPRTLVATGEDDSHFYLGIDGVYAYGNYYTEPSRVEWLFKSSATILNDINTSSCNIPCAGYDSKRQVIWFSWADSQSDCPNKSLACNLQFQKTSFVDAGFSAFCNHTLDVYKTLREWLTELCICTDSELDSNGGGYLNEGAPCHSCSTCRPVTAVTCTSAPTSIYSDDELVDDDVTTENYNAASASVNSLCARLESLDDGCSDEGNGKECSLSKSFIGVYTGDNCIKQFTEVFSREICTTFSACSAYRLDSYQSIIRSGPLDFGHPDLQKIMHFLECDVHALGTPDAGDLVLRYGVAYMAADPNDDECNLVWHTFKKRNKIKCPSTKSGAQHLAKNTRPDLALDWPLFLENRWHYFELSVQVNGVNACFNSLILYPEVRTY